MEIALKIWGKAHTFQFSVFSGAGGAHRQILWPGERTVLRRRESEKADVNNTRERR